MIKILVIVSLLFASVSYGAVTSDISFPAEVKAFDTNWVKISANNNTFRIPRKNFEATNGPTRSGKLLVHLNKKDFDIMKADRFIFK
ncbi:hypothetical protein [Bdellovibrio sp. NC01]|uniref:hypothetical protein n=1 Tax=Bdellovibrio sp. NC01 TaxID=2220073 RepID=UPI001158F1B1|nr:hypothetical protein [Bdellovibrio sp. NC01]QDK38558.1 hypothetical protein DOE51_13710 [Bdellovibrio sp. NC01]